jgi:hypothetical protein
VIIVEESGGECSSRYDGFTASRRLRRGCGTGFLPEHRWLPPRINHPSVRTKRLIDVIVRQGSFEIAIRARASTAYSLISFTALSSNTVSTVAALLYELRNGLSCLSDHGARARLMLCDEGAIRFIAAELLSWRDKNKSWLRPWSEEDVAKLAAIGGRRRTGEWGLPIKDEPADGFACRGVDKVPLPCCTCTPTAAPLGPMTPEELTRIPMAATCALEYNGASSDPFPARLDL